MIEIYIVLFLGLFNLICMQVTSRKVSVQNDTNSTEGSINDVKYELFVCGISVMILIAIAIKLGIIGVGNVATIFIFIGVIIGYKEHIKGIRTIYNGHKNDIISIPGVSAIGFLFSIFYYLIRSYSGKIVEIIGLKGNCLLVTEIIITIIREYFCLFLIFESIVLIGLLSYNSKRVERILQKICSYKNSSVYVFRKSKKKYKGFILKKVILYLVEFFKDVILNTADIIWAFLQEILVTLCNIMGYCVTCLYVLFDIGDAKTRPLVFKVKNFRIISKWSIIISMVIEYGMLMLINTYPNEIVNVYNFICGIIIIPMIITSVLALKKN